jgi:hypothetical protein
MERFQVLGGDPVAGPRGPRDAALAAFKAATEAGCDDPLVLCMYHLAWGSGGDLDRRAGPVPQPFSSTLRALEASKHHPSMKFWGLFRYIRNAGTRGQFEVQRTVKLVPQIAATPGLPRAELDTNAEQLYDAIRLSTTSTWRFYPGFLDAYTAAQPNTAGPLLMKGRMLLDKGYEERQFARGAEAEQTLREAEQCLEQAWKLDREDYRAANFMLAVKINQGEDGGGREAMELWFNRAMAANPDNLDACRRRLHYIRRYEDRDGMLAFGRWCLKTENWRGGIPFILADVHYYLAFASQDRKEYYAQPHVWEDLRSVYEGCVINFPTAIPQRNQYAKIAIQCGRWDVAKQQFEILGDKVMPQVFGSQTTLNYYKRKATRLAATQPTTRKSAG